MRKESKQNKRTRVLKKRTTALKSQSDSKAAVKKPSTKRKQKIAKQAKQENEPKKNKKTVKTIFNNYRDNLFAIKVYYNKFETLAIAQDAKELKKSSEYVKNAFAEFGIDLDNPSKQRKIPEEITIKLVTKLIKKPKISYQHHEILSSSSFLMLNNYFEYLISDLLTYYYGKFSDSIKSKELNISLSDLNEFNEIQDLKEHLVLREVEKLLVNFTFNELLNHFEEKLKVSLNKELIDWSGIIEARERRHLIVHNSSIVNKKYLSRSNNPSNFKLGDKVSVENQYFNSVFESYRLAGLLLALNCWGNWDKSNATKAIEELMYESFNQLKRGNFESTKIMADFSDNIKPRNEDEAGFLIRIKFNRCIALKQLKDENKLKDELLKIDVSTSEPLFKLAHAILSTEKPERIKELVIQCKKLDDINIEHYNEWPLYKLLKRRRKLNLELIDIINDKR